MAKGKVSKRKQPAGLLDDLDEQRRAQLRARGCHETGGMLGGRFLWRLPDRSVVDEVEAFSWLEAQEKTQ